jgi:hypothetical protein
MIRLNPKVKTVRHFEPPFPVTRHFDPVDTSAPLNEQIESLLWIPATLVSRYLGQFPYLENEAEEMFSVGYEQVMAIVHKGGHSGDKIGAVCNVQCRYHIEAYCNGLNSVVKVCTKTRYNNRNFGKPTPSHKKLVAGRHRHDDDHTELLLRDAAQTLQLDLDNLSLRQKRLLWDILN